MKQTLPRWVGALAVAVLGACASKPALVGQVDQRLENQISAQLDKRMALVRGNPTYLGLVQSLQKGRNQLKGNQADLAFQTFNDILKEPRYQNFPEYAFSKYYMGVALQGMGVPYGALLYYVDIVEKEPPQTHTHDALRRSIEIAQDLKDDELVLYLASIIPPNKIPKSLTEEMRYFQAKDLYQKRDFKKARTLLESISVRNRLYLGARYLLGATYTSEQNYTEAIRVYRAVSTHRSATKYYEEATIRNLSDLALARLLYEQKNFALATIYYRKVTNDSVFFPQALYEASWALFNLQKYNESLSVLHSVHSPFIEQAFFLKSYLLEGAIYLDLCRYDDVLRSLGYAEKSFGHLKSQIDSFAKRARSPKEYYTLLSSRKKDPKGNLTYVYGDLFNVATSNRDFLAMHRYIRNLQEQRGRIQNHPAPRAKLITNLLRQKEVELIDKASFLAGQKLLYTRQLIEDFTAMKDLLRYEIVSSERKILQSRSLKLAPPIRSDADLLKPKFTESLKETLIWWDFNGEYWEDELGYYLYQIESLCKDAQKEGNTQPKRPS